MRNVAVIILARLEGKGRRVLTGIHRRRSSVLWRSSAKYGQPGGGVGVLSEGKWSSRGGGLVGEAGARIAHIIVGIYSSYGATVKEEKQPATT